MPPEQGLAIMVSVLVGGLSGGLMAGILTGIPGTPSSVATTFDGFPMARKGEPGFALGLGVWSSFCGGMISAVMLVLFAPQLARVGLEFHPQDFFMLVIFALTVTASLAGRDLVKGLIAGALGLLARTVGEDDAVGMARFDFGSDALLGGFDFIAVLIGLFAFSQLLSDVRDPEGAKRSLTDRGNVRVRIENWRAIKAIARRWTTVLRSSLIGIFTGILPGAGGSIANILAYDQAKKASKNPEAFGTGVPEGIIAPESSNNAVEGGALTPLIALGIPGDVTTAIMLGALLIHDVVPSPSFISEEPVLAYSIFIAFFAANFIMAGHAVGDAADLRAGDTDPHVHAGGGDPRLRVDRRLRHQQRHLRCLDPVLVRHRRLHHAPVRFPPGADDPRRGAGQHRRAEPQPGVRDLHRPHALRPPALVAVLPDHRVVFRRLPVVPVGERQGRPLDRVLRPGDAGRGGRRCR